MVASAGGVPWLRRRHRGHVWVALAVATVVLAGLGFSPASHLLHGVPLTSREYVVDRDTTICEPDDGEGDMANSRGDGLYIGKINQGVARRALLYFDVSDLAGVDLDAVLSASLILYERRINWPTNTRIDVHRVTDPWQEGESSSVGGRCAVATSLDASWTKRRVGTNSSWSGGVEGGAFVASASAHTFVGTDGQEYLWHSDALLDDVRMWLNGSAQNNGWILIGDETMAQTAASFASREFADETLRPTLLIQLRADGGGRDNSNVVKQVVVPIVVTAMIVIGAIAVVYMCLKVKQDGGGSTTKTSYHLGRAVTAQDNLGTPLSVHDEDEIDL